MSHPSTSTPVGSSHASTSSVPSVSSSTPSSSSSASHPSSASHSRSHSTTKFAPPPSSRSVSSSVSGSSSVFPHPPNPFHTPIDHLKHFSPSRPDGFNEYKELCIRAQMVHFISMIGQACHISQVAIATASVYFHVFFARNSLRDHERHEVAVTCMFLAGKVEERRTRIDTVLEAFFKVQYEEQEKKYKANEAALKAGQKGDPHMLPPRLVVPHTEEFEKYRQRVYRKEYDVLDAIEYTFEFKHPYIFVMTFLKDKIYGPNYANATPDFFERELKEPGGLAQTAWLFINDSLRSTLCLHFSASVICVGVIALALHHKQMAPPVRAGRSAGQGKPWHEELFGVDEATVNAIKKSIIQCLEMRYILPKDLAKHRLPAAQPVKSSVPPSPFVNPPAPTPTPLPASASAASTSVSASASATLNPKKRLRDEAPTFSDLPPPPKVEPITRKPTKIPQYESVFDDLLPKPKTNATVTTFQSTTTSTSTTTATSTSTVSTATASATASATANANASGTVTVTSTHFSVSSSVVVAQQSDDSMSDVRSTPVADGSKRKSPLMGSTQSAVMASTAASYSSFAIGALPTSPATLINATLNSTSLMQSSTFPHMSAAARSSSAVHSSNVDSISSVPSPSRLSPSATPTRDLSSPFENNGDDRNDCDVNESMDGNGVDVDADADADNDAGWKTSPRRNDDGAGPAQSDNGGGMDDTMPAMEQANGMHDSGDDEMEPDADIGGEIGAGVGVGVGGEEASRPSKRNKYHDMKGLKDDKWSSPRSSRSSMSSPGPLLINEPQGDAVIESHRLMSSHRVLVTTPQTLLTTHSSGLTQSVSMPSFKSFEHHTDGCEIPSDPDHPTHHVVGVHPPPVQNGMVDAPMPITSAPSS